jgi:hypothetical protein
MARAALARPAAVVFHRVCIGKLRMTHWSPRPQLEDITDTQAKQACDGGIAAKSDQVFAARGIVIGHERHSRLHKALGTVTSELLDAAPVPVIAVPLASDEVPGPVLMQSGGAGSAPQARAPRASTRG